MRVDGTGDAVQIPALAFVVADFSELVVGPIIGNWESQITREPRRHIGDEGGTCVAGIDDTAADVARSVDAHLLGLCMLIFPRQLWKISNFLWTQKGDPSNLYTSLMRISGAAFLVLALILFIFCRLQ